MFLFSLSINLLLTLDLFQNSYTISRKAETYKIISDNIFLWYFQMFPVLMFLMAALVAAEPLTDLSGPVESDSESVVHCDAHTACPDGTTCCLSPYGVWFCCPFQMVNLSKQ